MRLATKTNLEREDEEAERLVRPAPKDKPPRRDRRRERMDPDSDPDIAGDPDRKGDPDLSKNYKDVGGSVDRVLKRWAKFTQTPGPVTRTPVQKTEPKKPKPEAKPHKTRPALAPKKQAPSAPASRGSQDLIPVRHKKTQQVVMVSPKTLQGEKASDYEAISDDEKEKAIAEAKKQEQEQTKKKESPAKEKDETGGDNKSEDTSPEAQAEAEAKAWVDKGEHLKKPFQRFLHSIPTGDDDAEGNPLVLDPETKKRVPFEQLSPVAQKNLIDAYGKQQQQAVAAKTEVIKQKRAATFMAELDPAVRQSLEALADPNSEVSKKAAALAKQHDLWDIKPEKLMPELKGKLPKGLTSVAQAQEIVQGAQAYDAMSERDRANIPASKKREVTPEEKQASLLVIAETFPPDTAADLIAQDLHPDDVKALTRGYQAALAEPVTDPQKYAEKAASLFETDPTKIKPPQEWKGRPFNFLSAEEQSAAMDQHQMEVLATSLAAKEKLTEALSMPGLSGKPRVHPAVAGGIAQYMLSKPDDPVAAAKMADEMAKTAYDTAVRQGKGTTFIANDPTAKALLKKLDPGGQKIVQSFLQARDYHAAKDKFLKTTADDSKADEDSFSERDKPSKILSGIRKALDFFRQSVGNDGTHRSERLFSNRVLDRLRALEPKKAAIIQAKIDQIEAKQYEADHKVWKKAHEKWKKARDEHDKTQPFGGIGKGSIPFPDPEPVEPTPPARYGYRGKSTKGDHSIFEELASRRKRGPKPKPRTKAAHRVARRYVSTYPGWLAMDQFDSKTAIYHGVEPYADDPGTYPDWKPAHQRDLSEADFAQILALAKKWLASPHVSGMAKDTQLRAALDLAVQDSKYNRKLHPAVYNMLLARLAGVPAPGPGETLQTVRGSICAPAGTGDTLPGQGPGEPTTETTMTTKLSAEQSKQASNILTQLDTLAQTVQSKYASWGMTKEDAKKVVNGLDAVADNFERSTFGEESLQRRQREVLAAVIQRDSDEPYMDTFINPHQPVQTDADEPYMGAYSDDQSSAVDKGKEENGEPLVP